MWRVGRKVKRPRRKNKERKIEKNKGAQDDRIF